MKNNNLRPIHHAIYKDLHSETPSQRNWLARNTVPGLKRLGIRILRRLGFLKSFERIVVPKYRCDFWGDRPIGVRSEFTASDKTDCFSNNSLDRSSVILDDYAETLDSFHVSNVTYTSTGFAWVGFTLDTNASVVRIRSPLQFFKQIPIRKKRKVEEGTIVQSQAPFTYGDWVPEHRNSIISARHFPRPLILPGWIASRPYVEKELLELGIEYTILDENIHIKNASVLCQRHPGNLILEDDVKRYRSAYNVPDITPKTGSIVYLSRESFTRTVEIAGRNYPSQVIGRIVEALGGKVIKTNEKDRDYYRKIAGEADIVIADHGGAMFNIMEWNPSVVIEIVEDGWWIPCFVCLSAACGAKYHGIIRSSHRSESDLRNQIVEHIKFGVTKRDRLTIKKISPE